MDLKSINEEYFASEQITVDDLKQLQQQGIQAIICNRPDGEGADQPSHQTLAKQAEALGIPMVYIPVERGAVQEEDVTAFKQHYASLPKPILGYCRSGMRAATLWTLANPNQYPLKELLARTSAAGFDLSSLVPRFQNQGAMDFRVTAKHDIVIVGAGAGGIAAASSLLKRRPDLDIAVIDPSDIHYYQPGWTMVGGGVFSADKTVKTMSSVIPDKVMWIKAAVAAFEPEKNQVILEGCRAIEYEQLIVCPGLKLNWAGIEGLEDTLGDNGVTSNYRFDLAPYTWRLVQQLKHGKAIFTQPPMPIKCAGAPQKAMYLSCDHWFRQGRIQQVDVQFMNAGPVLFGVADYVPALMEYVQKYGAKLNFKHKLIKIDGPNKTAWFEKTDDDGNTEIIEQNFDMIHVCPPQQAPDFIRSSKLVDEAGWVDVDQQTLRHKVYDNIYALGDVINAPNAKTAAAARKQAPIVAHNLLTYLDARNRPAHYDGYGSCPLTVERGKIVLAEFGYGGKLLPSFPKFFINGQKPSRLAWLLKERLLPPIYWKAMLKGREWLVNPKEAE